MSHANDPDDLDAYNARQAENQRIEGMGLETRMVVPCPGCGAADWLVIRPLSILVAGENTMVAPTTCAACGRTFRNVIEHPSESQTTLHIELLDGADLPRYLVDALSPIHDRRPKPEVQP